MKNPLNSMSISQWSMVHLILLHTFLHQLIKGKNLEKSAAFSSKQKHDMLSKKSVIGNLLPQ